MTAPLYAHVHTYLLAAQVVAVSASSTVLLLGAAALPFPSAARSLLLGVVPLAGLLRPAVENSKTRSSLRHLLRTMRQCPAIFVVASVLFAELKNGSGLHTNYGLRVTLVSVNATLACVAAGMIVYNIRPAMAIGTAGTTLLFHLAIHTDAPFSDPATNPLSSGASMLGAAALLLRGVSFCAVYCAHALTVGILLRVSSTDLLTTSCLAAAGSAYQLMLPFGLCPLTGALHLAVIVRLTYTSARSTAMRHRWKSRRRCLSTAKNRRHRLVSIHSWRRQGSRRPSALRWSRHRDCQ